MGLGTEEISFIQGSTESRPTAGRDGSPSRPILPGMNSGIQHNVATALMVRRFRRKHLIGGFKLNVDFR